MRQQVARIVARLDPHGVGVGLVEEGIDRHGSVIDRLVVAEAELHIVAAGAEVGVHQP